MLQQWLLLLYILSLYHINSTIKYTSLNPSTSSQNGATITLLKNTTTTSNSQSEWFISSINNIGFHMKLSLDNTWSFHPTYPTSLTIEIDSNSPSTINNTALLLLFSQLNKTYFSTMIQLDKSTDHLIYPKCEIYPNKSTFMHTNINNLSFNNRIQTASMQNKFDSYLLPHTNQPNISYPLTFILKNNPSQNASLFSYFNPISNIRTCAYNTMSINTSIDIYIALAYNLTQLNITSINITHFINDTTIEPTYNPTMEPTIEPTYNPTIEPTLLPTLLPSESPVIITTDKQLCIDCENITNNITSTLTTIIYHTTNIIPTDIQNNKNDNFITQLNIFGLNNNIFFALIICIVCVLCLCICLIIVIKKRKHRKNTKGMKVISNDSQIMNIKSQSTITMDNNINTNGMITKESFDSINKYENNINKSENINNKVTETETVELIELNEDKNNNNNNNVKVTVTAYDDDDDDDNNIDDSSDEKSLYNMNIPPVVPPVPNNNSDDDDDDEKDNNDDSDHSLYRLQHEYLHSEINEIEDEQERELLGNENNNNNNNNNEEGNVIQGMDKITDNGNGITDIGNGITDDGMNKNVYITDNGYNKEINSNESDDNDNDNDLITGITTTGGNDNDMDDENVPPPPMPPPPNDK